MTWQFWQVLIRALQSLKIGTFMGSFYPKYKMYELKIYRGAMCHGNKEWCKIWKGIDLSHKMLHIFTQALQNLKHLHFNALLLTKVYNVWGKKGQSTCTCIWWYWKLMQSLKKNWLVLSKMTWGIWQIFTRALESLKIGILWYIFIQSRKYMTLKFTGELCVMTMKNDGKFKEELTFQFKIDKGNLTKFDLSTEKSQTFAL